MNPPSPARTQWSLGASRPHLFLHPKRLRSKRRALHEPRARLSFAWTAVFPKCIASSSRPTPRWLRRCQSLRLSGKHPGMAGRLCMPGSPGADSLGTHLVVLKQRTGRFPWT